MSADRRASGQGARTCRIHVLATDVEGNVTDLGARSVLVRK